MTVEVRMKHVYIYDGCEDIGEYEDGDGDDDGGDDDDNDDGGDGGDDGDDDGVVDD